MSSQDAGEVSLSILQGTAKHQDPVCGMTVVPEKAAGKVGHHGKRTTSAQSTVRNGFPTIRKVLAAPDREMKHSSAPAEHVHTGAAALRRRQTKKRFATPARCIRRSSRLARSCPICGMALEPMDVLAEVEADPNTTRCACAFGSARR